MASIAETAFASLVNLFFPHVCAGCEQPLSRGEQVVCVDCISKLPGTAFRLKGNNPIEMLFAGRINIEMATACYFFHKEAVLQNMLHQFKYHGRRDVGWYMGRQMGLIIAASDNSGQFDGLVPVPLYYTKEKKRGYNQSAILCEGMAEILHLPVLPHAISRIHATESQTHKTRMNRWENVQSAFEIRKAGQLKGRHVLLVDDVVTTGATIEACARPILKIPGAKVSVAALAMATF